MMLVVHPSVRADSLAEFVALAKTSSLTYGSGGARGNPGHLTMESLRMRAGFDLVHVTYKGNPQVVADLVGGHVQAGFLATPSVLELVKEGKLRGLAVSGSRRESGAPNVPTAAEAGYPDFDIGFFQVMLAPGAIPGSIRALIEREVQRVVTSADFQARLRAQHLHPIGSNGAEAAAVLKAAAARWKAAIAAAHIRPE
jgi:tripartite-type tricarboxylate transporter receptor subunit TctC